MPLVGAGSAVYGVVYGDGLIAIKGTALAFGGAVEIYKFCYCAAGVWS